MLSARVSQAWCERCGRQAVALVVDHAVVFVAGSEGSHAPVTTLTARCERCGWREKLSSCPGHVDQRAALTVTARYVSRVLAARGGRA